MQSGLRAWVERQTGHPLGYIEQLYTFADRDRTVTSTQRVISISYLGLTREGSGDVASTGWHGWYDYFPWEDHRAGVPSLVPDILVPRLPAWADERRRPSMRHDRRQRAASLLVSMIATGTRNSFCSDTNCSTKPRWWRRPRAAGHGNPPSVPGRPMIADHRRILATGIASLRTKIKYRPVVFELMPADASHCCSCSEPSRRWLAGSFTSQTFGA